ncbi:hypothetical protein [Streptomyces bauhiniae]|uniref:hypothetical protein n=1 Tax=Streptomyces bauhiniae TaxID=2340725 RepID=UPI0035DE43C2
MTDRPYTDDDLRAEAARQLAHLPDHLDKDRVGQEMCGAAIESHDSDRQWDALDDNQFDTAEQAIHNLIKGSANTSDWAVNLGADRLEPTGHTLELGIDPGDGNRPRVRLHFAFHPDVLDADRDCFVMDVTKTVLRNL